MLDVGMVSTELTCGCLFMIGKILQCNDLLKVPTSSILLEMLYMQTNNSLHGFFILLGKKEFFLRGMGGDFFVFLRIWVPQYLVC